MNTTSIPFQVSAMPADSPVPNNRTRRTRDLTAKFWRTGQWHLIPLYHLLRLSNLAREGIEHSGSYLFADHLYENRASGRALLGQWLDRVLLSTRAAKAMRQRCAESTRVIQERLDEEVGEVHMLAIPCGIPRDVSRLHHHTERLHYTGMDLDPEVLAAAQAHLEDHAAGLLGRADFIHGNALNDLDFPQHPQDVIVSTGLGEFLDDAQLRVFYRHVFETLQQGGVFYTSATHREGSSDYLLRAFELHAHYRTEAAMRAIFAELPWSQVEFTHDATGLQTFVRAWR